MNRCSPYNFLFSVFPWKPWRDFLIRRHGEKCPICRAKLISAEEARSFLIQERDVEVPRMKWPPAEARIGEGKKGKRRYLFSRWGWALAASGLLAVLIAGFLFFRSSAPPESLTEQDLVEHIQINYVKVGGKPARTFLFQPQDSKMIIVWVERNM